MKRFYNRVWCAFHFFNLWYRPFTLIRFLRDPDMIEWCDKFYNLMTYGPSPIPGEGTVE